MLIEKDGDILNSDADIICQQVNCRGVMGAGLAKQIRSKYPYVYNTYKCYCNSVFPREQLLGQVLCVPPDDGSDSGEPLFACLFGQKDYGGNGCYTDYTALERCFRMMTVVDDGYWNEPKELVRIAFPYGIGCGLAGGDWTTVRNLLEQTFAYADPRIHAEIWRRDG